MGFNRVLLLQYFRMIAGMLACISQIFTKGTIKWYRKFENMFFGIKREISCFFIGYESVEIRSFAPKECNARPYTRKK